MIAKTGKLQVLKKFFLSLTLLLGLHIQPVLASSLGGDFSLTTHSGERFSLNDARGKIVLLFFGYTHCPDVCPDTLARVRILMRETDQADAQIQPLFVTVDPERDTPEVLANYVQYFHPSVIGLTGTTEEIEAVVKQYKAHYRLLGKEGNYTVDHTAHLFVIDQQGKLARILPYGLPMEELTAAVQSLLDENAKESSSVNPDTKAIDGKTVAARAR